MTSLLFKTRKYRYYLLLFFVNIDVFLASIITQSLQSPGIKPILCLILCFSLAPFLLSKAFSLFSISTQDFSTTFGHSIFYITINLLIAIIGIMINSPIVIIALFLSTLYLCFSVSVKHNFLGLISFFIAVLPTIFQQLPFHLYAKSSIAHNYLAEYLFLSLNILFLYFFLRFHISAYFSVQKNELSLLKSRYNEKKKENISRKKRLSSFKHKIEKEHDLLYEELSTLTSLIIENREDFSSSIRRILKRITEIFNVQAGSFCIINTEKNSPPSTLYEVSIGDVDSLSTVIQEKKIFDCVYEKKGNVYHYETKEGVLYSSSSTGTGVIRTHALFSLVYSHQVIGIISLYFVHKKILQLDPLEKKLRLILTPFILKKTKELKSIHSNIAEATC